MTPDRTSAIPGRIVALGGGTGLPAVLRGLKEYRPAGNHNGFLTAVVTMSDDGGSSGRLRSSMNLPPPGDVRNCLVALSEEENDQFAGLFQYRYDSSEELKGHSVGNLILAALAEQTGCFVKAVEASGRFLRTVGKILPATQETVTLEAELVDGSMVSGETRIACAKKAIRRVSLKPRDAQATPGIVEAIHQAELVVVGPGSLYTSTVPNLVVKEIGRALNETRAVVVLVANLVSERGEASGLGLLDHIEVIEDHAGYPILDAVLVNNGRIGTDTLKRYEADGAIPLFWPKRKKHRIHVQQRNLLAKTAKLRHDPRATASGLVDTWRDLTGRQKINQVC